MMHFLKEPNSTLNCSTLTSEIPVSSLLHPNFTQPLPHSPKQSQCSSMMPTCPFTSLPPSSPSICSPMYPTYFPEHVSLHEQWFVDEPSSVTPRPFYVFNASSYALMLRSLLRGTSPKIKEIMEADAHHGLPTKRWKRLQGNLRIVYVDFQPKLVWKSCSHNLIIEPIEAWDQIFREIHITKNERGQIQHIKIQKCLEMLTHRYQYRRSRCGLTVEDFRQMYSKCTCQQLLVSTGSSPSFFSVPDGNAMYLTAAITASFESPSNLSIALSSEFPKNISFPYSPTTPWPSYASYSPLESCCSVSSPFPSADLQSPTHPSAHDRCFTPPSDLILPPLVQPFRVKSSATYRRKSPSPLSLTSPDPTLGTDHVQLPSIHFVLQAYPSPKART